MRDTVGEMRAVMKLAVWVPDRDGPLSDYAAQYTSRGLRLIKLSAFETDEDGRVGHGYQVIGPPRPSA